jgi:archaellum biogenesis ATPase FlaH
MEENYHYATVTEAIDKLRHKGYTVDFNIVGEHLVCDCNNTNTQLGADDFDIVDVYRYEGNSDPADEAVVYAVESRNGIKGVLVTGYGATADITSSKILEKLSTRQINP